LNTGLVLHNDPGYFNAQRAKMKAVTAADVKRVANTYLGNRVVLSIVPMGKTELASKPESSVKVTVSPDGGHYIMGAK
jgi:predicted Zn-dependent peptidase